MKNKHIIIGILSGIIPVLFFAQDIHFSQFHQTPLNLNPAQAGAQYDLRAQVNYKSQWGSVADAYNTANVSFDMQLNKKKKTKAISAIGISLFNDKAGDARMGTFQGNLAYACHIHLNSKSTLGAGLYGGFFQRSIKYDALQWANQYDGMAYNASLSSGEPLGENSIMNWDMGGGLHYEFGKAEKYMTGNDQRNFSAGVSFFHVNQPKYSFYSNDERLNMRMVGYANALFGISNSQYSVVPGVVYFRQGTTQEILMGTMLRYQLKEESKYTGYVKGSAISLGAYYRNKDAVIFNLLYEISNYAIGISYDVNVSDLSAASSGRGGIEISLRFVNPNPFIFKSASSF